MEKTHAFRVSASVAGIVAAGLSLAGCSTGPTYGTDKTSGEQLMSDLGSAISVAPSNDGPKPKYAPRPGLVRPAKGSVPALVPPEASLADRKNNPNWAETPEEMRARLKAEADANEGNPNYRSPLLDGRGQSGTMTEEQKWQAFRKAKAEASPASALQTRRYLSDPPVQYRQPAPTAAADELGESEAKKEKRRLKEAEAKNGSSSGWWNPFK